MTPIDEALFLDPGRDGAGDSDTALDRSRDTGATHRSRTASDRGRIIITGTGRAGTTLLVQIFTALGFDTGYTLDEAMTAVNEIASAGLEKIGFVDALPYVAKSPLYVDTLPSLLASETIRVHAAIVPVRDLVAAAESRRRVHFEAERRGLNTAMQPGGLWHTSQPDIQEYILATQFYQLVHALVRHGVPLFLFEFPRFAQDPDYFYDSLASLMDEHGVARVELRDACRRVVDLGKITIRERADQPR